MALRSVSSSKVERLKVPEMRFLASMVCVKFHPRPYEWWLVEKTFHILPKVSAGFCFSSSLFPFFSKKKKKKTEKFARENAKKQRSSHPHTHLRQPTNIPPLTNPQPIPRKHPPTIKICVCEFTRAQKLEFMERWSPLVGAKARK